jgi:hypothetical protein
MTKALPAIVGPLIERVPGTPGEPRVEVTPAGLSLVEATARAGGSQALCAAKLAISLSTFKRIINEDDGNNAVRLAFEKGKAELEFEVATLLLRQGRKGNTIALIFYSKSQLGWSDQPQVNNQTAIQIVLPDSLDRAAFAQRIAERTEIAPPHVEEVAS